MKLALGLTLMSFVHLFKNVHYCATSTEGCSPKEKNKSESILMKFRVA